MLNVTIIWLAKGRLYQLILRDGAVSGFLIDNVSYPLAYIGTWEDAA